MKTNKPMADFFYEQCAGTFAGHMSNVANNPTLYGVLAAHSTKHDDFYAASKTEFAEFLVSVAENLTEDK